MGEVGYKKLIVWQQADEFAFQVYTATRDFLKDEIYGIISQLRRAALSVPTNIVEGYGRGGRKELKQFLNIALGSLAETRYLLDFSLRLKYLNSATYTRLQDLAEEVGKLLWKFYKAQEELRA
jgi:four helix bundle protein